MRRVTLGYDDWGELEDITDPQKAGREWLCAAVPHGRHGRRNVVALSFHDVSQPRQFRDYRLRSNRQVRRAVSTQ